MPLISDAKQIYVGTTPITTVMAGDKLVWDSVKIKNFQLYYKTQDPDINKIQPQWVYASWETEGRWIDCDSVTDPQFWQFQWEDPSAPTGWRSARWDLALLNCLPASPSTFMAMQVFQNVTFDERKCRIRFGLDSTQETNVFSNEITIRGNGSSDPNFSTFPNFPMSLYYQNCQNITPKNALEGAQWYESGTLYAGARFNSGLKNADGPPCIKLQANYQQRILFQGQPEPVWQTYTGSVDQHDANISKEAFAYIKAGTSATVHSGSCTVQLRKLNGSDVIWQDEIQLSNADLIYTPSFDVACS